MNKDTICAIATALSPSGIGIIRISGENAVEIADRFFRFPDRTKKLADMNSHTLHYGFVYDGDEKIDEVMVLLMRGPKSYTKEDTVEIDCHGGIFVMQKILETVIKNGARPAEPGEFTKRAFLNGRIDLSQAESVMDIIDSQNQYALKASMDQLSGKLSAKIKELRELLLHEIAFIESALDDPEHFSLEGYPQKLLSLVSSVEEAIDRLLATAENGRILKEGIKTAILGKPNVGKSSLLNCLLGYERAIVTDIAGTTRDTLEEQINIKGITLSLIDTAGIHDTVDPVESMGVKKAYSSAETADLILYVIDASDSFDEEDAKLLSEISDKKAIVLFNKSDLSAKTDSEEIGRRCELPVIECSAKTGQGMPELEKMIGDMFVAGELSYNNQVIITNARHKASLLSAKESLELVKTSIHNEMPEDFFSIDLMGAYEALGSVIGEAVEDDLVNEIFSKFCMGK